ncbi:hypothetical protein B0J14DRAFT_600365 [Halenospora varia]|nr:hypothetical protein B0J14DRAFT_600365 [Halenospora varia]
MANLESFTLFPRLPCELQRAIWTFALEAPRLHNLTKPNGDYQVRCVRYPITCRENCDHGRGSCRCARPGCNHGFNDCPNGSVGCDFNTTFCDHGFEDCQFDSHSYGYESRFFGTQLDGVAQNKSLSEVRTIGGSEKVLVRMLFLPSYDVIYAGNLVPEKYKIVKGGVTTLAMNYKTWLFNHYTEGGLAQLIMERIAPKIFILVTDPEDDETRDTVEVTFKTVASTPVKKTSIFLQVPKIKWMTLKELKKATGVLD